jgi:hypothetical protein
MTPILTRLARDIDDALGGSVCQDAIRDASNGGADLSLVHWRFLADVLRTIPKQLRDVQAVIDTVIAGVDRLGRGEEWTEAEAAWWAAAEATTPVVAVVAVAHVALSVVEEVVVVAWGRRVARRTATVAAVTRDHQRDILLRLIEEANE